MNKPLTVAADEFMQAVIHHINTSGLPAFVLAGLLEDAVKELRKVSADQLRTDNDVWNKFQEEQERAEMRKSNGNTKNKCQSTAT